MNAVHLLRHRLRLRHRHKFKRQFQFFVSGYRSSLVHSPLQVRGLRWPQQKLDFVFS